MPPRTNDFQKLVYLVQLNLAAGATVTESKMLTDRFTNGKREVDVCIEGHVGGTPVMVCVECRDHQRIADVSWVDQMKAKHERVPTNALILASRSGFTPEARTAAENYRIKTFSLEEMDQAEADLPTVLGIKSSVWMKTGTITVTKTVVSVPPTSTLPAETFVATPDNLAVYRSDGTEVGQLATLVEMMCRSRPTQAHILAEGREDHGYIEISWEQPRVDPYTPLFVKKIAPETLREIHSMQVTGTVKIEITQFGMEPGKLGDVWLAWGTTTILGRDTVVVATKDSAGVQKLAINISGKPRPAIPPSPPDTDS